MGNELERYEAAEREALEVWQSEQDKDDDFIIPLLKAAQSNTGEHQSGDAAIGDFVNSLTGEVYGNVIEFVVASTSKGRFRTNDDGDVICTGRESACPCHSVPYPECPEAEEQWSAAVQRGEKEWGKGPPCATTFNFTGFIPGSDMPVTISLKRSDAKVAKKWLTMLRFARAPWDVVFQLETKAAEDTAGHKWRRVTVKQAGNATTEQRQQAVAIATLLRNQKTRVVGQEDDETPKPERNEDGIDY